MINETRQKNIKYVLTALRKVSRLGAVPATGTSASSVGTTLIRELDKLGLPMRVSGGSVSIRGLKINSSRQAKNTSIGKANSRVNLMIKVPDWDISACKASAEILDRYGWVKPESNNSKQLYCTVKVNQANSFGLSLEVDRKRGWLQEIYTLGTTSTKVATWRFASLEQALLAKHSASFWVGAIPRKIGQINHFAYSYATYTGVPDLTALAELFENGVITMDHLIRRDERGRVSERGPLFKIAPRRFNQLFPTTKTYHLLSESPEIFFDELE